jgi:5-dehydro-2-deoxygluconokinase
MPTAFSSPVYMMAIDHRWQWAEWCDRHRIDHMRIREVKKLAADAFLLARRDSACVRDSGVLLVDLVYGVEAFARARAGGATVGTPAERAGVFPLEWTDSFDRALRGDFAKVLVRHKADIERHVFDDQLSKLAELHQWCGAVEKPLVLEVLVSGPPDDAAFEREGRPRLLAAYIRTAYERGIVPQYWKIEGVPDASVMAVVDGAIREREGPKQLILGKGAGLDTVNTWFEAARDAASAAGFAIGRTVYWKPACEFLLGRLAADDAVHEMAGNYRTVIDLWRRAQAPDQGGSEQRTAEH